MKVNCAYCGKELNRPPSRVKNHKNQFCDMDCLGKFRENQVKVKCAVCGKEWSVKKSRAEQNDNITCSPKCLSKLRAKQQVNHWGSQEKRKTNCDYCGKEIIRKPSHIAAYEHNYCNFTCKSKHQSKLQKGKYTTGKYIKCDNCGKEIYRTPATTNDHNFCSRECFVEYSKGVDFVPPEIRKEIGAKLSGSNNPNWNGGCSPYTPGFTKELKNEIRKRDNYKCQICGKPEKENKNHPVHHIDFSKDNHSKDNLILLCWSCHRTIHNQERKETRGG